MKLFKCLNIADACELSTVGEAVYNVKLHAPSTFGYLEIDKELNELEEEQKIRGIPNEMLIEDALNIINKQDETNLVFG